MTQEIMDKPPEGFRALTPDEKGDFLEVGANVSEWQNRVALCEEQIKRHTAELEAARLRAKDAASELRAAQVQAKKLNERFGIKAQSDVALSGRAIYVRVGPKSVAPPADGGVK